MSVHKAQDTIRMIYFILHCKIEQRMKNWVYPFLRHFNFV